jgi:hypothetical protein
MAKAQQSWAFSLESRETWNKVGFDARKTMADNETLRYRVNVKSLKQYPSVGTDGVFNQTAIFHVTPLDNGIGFDYEAVVGGETQKRCQRLQQRGHIVVEFAAATWPHTRAANWQEEIVNVALEEAAKNSHA